MAGPGFSLPASEPSGAWLRLRTLILLRWLAVIGQTAAVLVASLGLGAQIRLDLCAAVIGASALLNVAAMAIAARNRRLSDVEATLTLVFDIVQLAALLYLTGGLSNPFALLMLAPVTIGASVLSQRAAILLVLVAAGLVTLLAVAHLPLGLEAGAVLALPPVLVAGAWAALVIGMTFISLYARRVSRETLSMSRALTAARLALEREQQIAAIGGTIAAAAHEFGTPLSTIRIVAAELADALRGDPELRDDALTIRAQTDRCREILRAMTARQDHASAATAPLSAIVEEAAEPHRDRGIRIFVQVPANGGESAVPRAPEIVQGLRNLIQNAVDFARTTVWIDIGETPAHLSVTVGDDGPGFPPGLAARIGLPRPNRAYGGARREGLGLGLAIAQSLLERSGAELSFRNGDRPGKGTRTACAASAAGAIVSVVWPRGRIPWQPDPELRPRAKG